jgi:hypothetical protein
MWGASALCIKQYGEDRLFTINDSGELISNLKPNLKSFQRQSKGLERTPFVKKPEAKNSLTIPLHVALASNNTIFLTVTNAGKSFHSLSPALFNDFQIHMYNVELPVFT